ncbi:single-stranded-DNA-specific exonuclease RecJ [Ruminococcaceae bacterium OttesenSCG-928-D13]|nr:single-stranded-DNA-specific exonuclease RecJ [Ruminococcaceae bacterium OttesenSCG-928-D13]
MLYREWNVRTPNAEKSAALSGWFGRWQGKDGNTPHGAGRLLCDVLCTRGIDTPEAAADFLGSPAALPNPYAIKDMDKAVRRIAAALENEESIAVFGDYDVDGITATALMYTWLENQGAHVFYKLPSRSDDDYGLSPALVDTVADRGITLIITVDNGTTAFEAVARAKERGVSIVITDHHLPYDTLPEVEALVNPCRPDDESGLACLSGAGVAFMVLAALEGCTAEELLPEFGDLVAIGTVADVMKLVGPNRAIVSAGMAALQETQRPGLAALIEACGWAEKGVTVENISYGIAPRLNAAGRMDNATSALRLLLTEDEEEARELVEGLQQQNAARQKAEGEILDLIAAQMEAEPELLRARVLVIWGEGWHQGVIGIVASRLVDKYAKPAIVITFEDGEGKGSGRSVAGFSLHGAIASCEDILLRYGGHDLAAGFSLTADKVVEFRRRVNEWAAENVPVPALPCITADAAARLEDLSVDEVRGLDLLSPCGSGNPSPKILLEGVQIDAVYPVSEGKHCRVRLRQGGHTIYAVQFGCRPNLLAYRVGDEVDVLMSLSVYEGKGGAQVSARVLEMRPAGMTGSHVAQCALFESFYAGGSPAADQKLLLAPTREDTALVYRHLRDSDGLNYGDLRPVFKKLGEEMAGRVLTALAALEELDLIERDNASGCYKAVQVQGKRDLASSALLQRLAQ